VTPWLVLSPSPPHRCDGIGDNAWHSTRAMVERGVHAELVVRRAGVSAEDSPAGAGLPMIHGIDSWRALAQQDWVDRSVSAAGAIVHFIPQAFARPDLLALLRWLGRFDDARPAILTLHELWVPTNGSARRAIVRAAHDRMLAALLQRVRRVAVTNAMAARMLQEAGLARDHDVRVIPVGANIEPAGPVSPAAEPLLVLFGQPAGMHMPTLQAIGRWLERAPAGVRLCWIGRSPDELRDTWSGTLGLASSRVQFAGGMSAGDVSAQLGAAQIALAPYVDGVSTRRSSLATLLAHHLPVVGLDGMCTEALQRDSGAFALSGLDRPDDFVANIAALLDDGPRRARMSAAAAHLHARHLSWDQIAAAYLDLGRTLGSGARS
jgi:glycosyltransferase involved in cell wall biosynthesis